MAVVLVGVAAGAAAFSSTVGRAAEATLDRAACPRTCQLGAAKFVVVTEEGSGRCFFYPYATQAQAEREFNCIARCILSRITYKYDSGRLSEFSRRGPARPHNTIRRAAKRLAIWGKVFVQNQTVGKASIHFLSDSCAQLRFNAEACATWQLDDGTPMPARKSFEAISYDPDTRVFRGTINWHPATFCGNQVWEYELVFDEDFSGVMSGRMQAYTPGLTEKGSSGQVLMFGRKQDPSAGCLLYERWRRPESKAGAPDTSVAGDAGSERPTPASTEAGIFDTAPCECSEVEHVGVVASMPACEIVGPLLRADPVGIDDVAVVVLGDHQKRGIEISDHWMRRC
mmetsp:Transcript_19804/g.56690  ORF Transcript_19804/g.56690 Transcript_19804/m.56690 type:complete len:341 (-) Transcript_19804:55-1077(-)